MHVLYIKKKSKYMNNKNIKQSLVLLIIILSAISCVKEPAENFPYASVNVTVNLISFPIGIGTAVVCPNSTNQGALGKGIILYNAGSYGEVNYIAYSALCTYYPKDTSTIVINPDLNTAHCPKCKTEYFLLDGSVLNGPSKWPLKQYNVTVSSDGNSLIIQN